jgi:hypothetical protein
MVLLLWSSVLLLRRTVGRGVLLLLRRAVLRSAILLLLRGRPVGIRIAVRGVRIVGIVIRRCVTVRIIRIAAIIAAVVGITES